MSKLKANLNPVTAEEMKALDLWAIEVLGIPSIVLMENAGLRAAEVVALLAEERFYKKIVCVCGKGNNAGDGFVCVRHLFNRGFDVEVILVEEESRLKGDAKTNYDILKK